MPSPPPYHQLQQQQVQHGDSDSSDDEDCHDKNEMHKHCEEAKAALVRYGFPENHEAQICIALDVSDSMERTNYFYSSQKIQKLIDKAMSLAIELSPGKHTVTIIPFGRTAYEPVEIDEHDVKYAVEKVMEAIGGQLSDKTNYHGAVKKIRSHYFGNCNATTGAVISDKPPVFVLFVTDGEHNLEKTEALNQFAWAERNAIFFKFIALKGLQQNLRFKALEEICANNSKTFLPNRRLLILNDPDELTIQLLFYGYRMWVEEAHEHKVLKNDPKINLDIRNPDDIRELAEKEALERQHGHEDVGSRHEHSSYRSYADNRYRQSYPGERVMFMPPPQRQNLDDDCCRTCTIS
jgi:hypothetical protein